MRNRKYLAVASAAALSSTALIWAATPANAEPSVDVEPRSFQQARAEVTSTVDAEVLTAMMRDLDLSEGAAYDRLAVDRVATDIEAIAAIELFGDYAGTWVNEKGTGTVVAITDPDRADDVTDLGATPTIVDHNSLELDSVKADLDKIGDSVPDGVHSWFVDITTNRVVVAASDEDAAADFIADAEVDASIVDVRHSTEQPEPLYNIRGGDAYYMGGRCSVGFAITHSGGSGFVTAGHCGTTGTAVSGYNQVALGQFRGSSFPGNDYAWVSSNSNWTSTNKVNGYGQADFTVTDGSEKPTGASVCRSGSTTGVHCGTIGAKDQTVSYPQGTVYGMTRTNVCAEPGDSGGSWISGGSAQGVTSGGSGNCTSGGTTYFFPLTDIMAAYPGLTLKTSGEGGPNPGGCESAEENFAGSLTGTNDYDYQPNGNYYDAAAGTHVGCLAGPSGTDYDLYLQKWNGSSWQTVAQGETSSSNESVTYNGTAGSYVWVVSSYSGSGSYSFGLTTP